MIVPARRLGAGLLATAAVGAAALGLSACGGSSSSDAAAAATPATTAAATPATTAAATAADHALDVTLGAPSELAMTVSATRVAAGKVTFHVTNSGSVTHEMVVIRTPTPSGDLPMQSGEASEAGSAGETGDMTAGTSTDLKLTLPAGHYALICNLPGHYAGGMHTDLTVG